VSISVPTDINFSRAGHPLRAVTPDQLVRSMSEITSVLLTFLVEFYEGESISLGESLEERRCIKNS
jgi:hypothetical protein